MCIDKNQLAKMRTELSVKFTIFFLCVRFNIKRNIHTTNHFTLFCLISLFRKILGFLKKNTNTFMYF